MKFDPLSGTIIFFPIWNISTQTFSLSIDTFNQSRLKPREIFLFHESPLKKKEKKKRYNKLEISKILLSEAIQSRR